MTFIEKVNKAILDATKARDQVRLRGLRAIKAAIQLANTDGSGKEMDADREIQLLQKLIKQRKESLDIYKQQNRPDLAQKEEEEIVVIEEFLPAQMSEAEVEEALKKIISSTGANSAKDMGKVMGLALKELAGKTDGKMVSNIVKRLLA